MSHSEDARALARRHTTQLLKMLRGYGPTETNSEPAAESKAVLPEPVERIVAESAVTSQVVLPAQRADHIVADAADRSDQVIGQAVADTASRYHNEQLEWARHQQRAPANPSPTTNDVTAAPRPHPRDYRIATVGETLFRQKGVLGELLAQAEQRVRLNQIFQAYLPPHLHGHAVLIRLDAEAWVVHADAATWATRLRYALHNIREALGQQLGIPLPKPHIRVVPVEKPTVTVRPRLKLTKRSAKVLESAARNQSYEPLSAALRRLAAHANPSR